MSRKTRRARPILQEVEDRLVPAPIPSGSVLVTPDDGGIPRVKVVDPATGEDVAEFQAYEDQFRGGVHAALGDVTGDGVDDLVIAPGQGGGPRIRIVDGQTGATLSDFFV
ncbi:MAG TPA: hypothetical protein VM533_09445, partial [Fimbriiglobus sp.]|nr:hypothetical protein [Fimbriiglobus sp.]